MHELSLPAVQNEHTLLGADASSLISTVEQSLEGDTGPWSSSAYIAEGLSGVGNSLGSVIV